MKKIIAILSLLLILITPVSAYTLNDVLQYYEHPYEYQSGVYDCTEMAYTTAYFLQEVYGYDTLVGIGQEKENIYHAWVIVRGNGGWIAVESTLGGIGEITYQDKYYHANTWCEWYEVYEYTS